MSQTAIARQDARIAAYGAKFQNGNQVLNGLIAAMGGNSAGTTAGDSGVPTGGASLGFPLVGAVPAAALPGSIAQPGDGAAPAAPPLGSVASMLDPWPAQIRSRLRARYQRIQNRSRGKAPDGRMVVCVPPIVVPLNWQAQPEAIAQRQGGGDSSSSSNGWMWGALVLGVAAIAAAGSGRRS